MFPDIEIEELILCLEKHENLMESINAILVETKAPIAVVNVPPSPIKKPRKPQKKQREIDITQQFFSKNGVSVSSVASSHWDSQSLFSFLLSLFSLLIFR